MDNGNSKTKKVLTYLAGFCDNTSIHGFRYFAERIRLVLEKWVHVWKCSFTKQLLSEYGGQWLSAVVSTCVQIW